MDRWSFFFFLGGGGGEGGRGHHFKDLKHVARNVEGAVWTGIYMCVKGAESVSGFI